MVAMIGGVVVEVATAGLTIFRIMVMGVVMDAHAELHRPVMGDTGAAGCRQQHKRRHKGDGQAKSGTAYPSRHGRSASDTTNSPCHIPPGGIGSTHE